MKQLLIGLLTLTALPALASNGSGTMGIVSISNPEKIDLRATPIIRFDGINGGDLIISRVVDLTIDGSGIVKQAAVPVILVPESWQKALQASRITGTFEHVRAAEIAPATSQEP